MLSKKELRKQILQIRDTLTPEQRKSKSTEISKRVIAQKAFQEADTILLFASYKSEVETKDIFLAARKAGKKVYYPKVNGKEMEFYLVEQEADLLEGYRGILEPKASTDKQYLYEKILGVSELKENENAFVSKQGTKICVIMPGAVFDKEGNRIGYGGGFYDKYLTKLEHAVEKKCSLEEGTYITKIAIAFSCQVVETGNIVCETHDVKPDYIITEEYMFAV